jgi:predicted DNA-binding WGR domain protein
MIESNKTKRIDMNTFYVWIQEELSNKFYDINQQDKGILEDLDDVGKTTSEKGQAMMAYLGDDDDDDEILRVLNMQRTKAKHYFSTSLTDSHNLTN